MSTTYDLTVEAARLALDIADLDDDEDIDGALAERLTAYLDGAEDKLERLFYAAKRLDTEARELTVEAGRLRARAARHKAAGARVRELAAGLLEEHERLTGEAKIQGPHLTAWLQTTRRVVGPDDPLAWPEAFRRFRVEADKAAAKRALEGGETIEGVSLQESRGVRWR